MKIARCALAALSLIALLTPTAKADTFVYQVTATDGLGSIDVTFELPTFQEFVDATTFTEESSNFGPVTEFELSGGSAKCSLNGLNESGPCWQAITVAPGGGCCLFANASPSFSGPGTFTATDSSGDTTVTITDVSGAVPEPSSLALLPFGLVALLVMRKRMTPQLAR